MKYSGLVCYILLLNAVTLCFGEAEKNPDRQSSSGSPAKCFVCNELNNERCKDPFKGDADLIKPCEKGETFCRKITQTVGGKTTVVRQCAKELYKPNYDGCYKTAGKSSQTVCTCPGNDRAEPCNNGLKINTSIVALCLSVLFSYLLLK